MILRLSNPFPLCSMEGFCPLSAHLWALALLFDMYSAPVELHTCCSPWSTHHGHAQHTSFVWNQTQVPIGVHFLTSTSEKIIRVEI